MRSEILCFLMLACYVITAHGQNTSEPCLNETCLNHSMCVDGKRCMCESGYASSSSNETSCNIKLDQSCGQDYCVTCDPSNAVKCFQCQRGRFLDTSTGSCAPRCNIGTQIEPIRLANNVTLSRLICIPDTTPTDPNAPTWVFAVLVLILLLILAGVGIVICYLVYIRYKVLIPNLNWKQRSFELSTVEANTRAGAAAGGKKDTAVEIVRGIVRPDVSCSSEITPSIPDKDTDTKSIVTTTEITSIQSEDSVSATNPGFERDLSPEKLSEEFNEKLNALRERAPTFLQMLNDMRRRLKELPADHKNVPQYKAVMRDVTRLLYLLNKRPENVEIPPDGVKLLGWAERILQRYVMAQEVAKKMAKESRQPQPQGAKPRVSMILGEQDETKF